MSNRKNTLKAKQTENIDISISINVFNLLDDEYVEKEEKILEEKIKEKYVPPSMVYKKIEVVNYDNNTTEELTMYNEEKTNGFDLKLNSLWKLWIHENDNEKWDIDSYDFNSNIDNIASLWRFLNSFNNLDKFNRQFYVMRDGIMPIWEDNNNKNGVICSFRIENINVNPKIYNDVGVDIFSCFCIMVLNECFTLKNSDINGLCYSIKNKNILIKFWIKNYEENKNFIEKLPLPILTMLENIINSLDTKKYHKMNSNKISIQVKQIFPEN